VGLDPAHDRLLGGEADRDDETHVAPDHGLVEDPRAVRGDRRARVLGQRPKMLAVLAEDRVDERVQEQVRAVQAKGPEEMLHACARAPRERPVRQRLVLCALLADDDHHGRAVQAAPKEHRPMMPPEAVPTENRMRQATIVRGLGEQIRPA
jgi:hypothetical protein